VVSALLAENSAVQLSAAMRVLSVILPALAGLAAAQYTIDDTPCATSPGTCHALDVRPGAHPCPPVLPLPAACHASGCRCSGIHHFYAHQH
jgi:hypothetical protein